MIQQSCCCYYHRRPSAGAQLRGSWTEKQGVRSHERRLRVTCRSSTHPLLPKHRWSPLSTPTATHCWFHPLMETAVAEKVIRVPFSHPNYWQGNANVLLVPLALGTEPFCMMRSLTPGQGENCRMPAHAPKSDK